MSKKFVKKIQKVAIIKESFFWKKIYKPEAIELKGLGGGAGEDGNEDMSWFRYLSDLSALASLE